MEADHDAGRCEHRPGRARAHGRRGAPFRLVAPDRTEHGGPPPQRHLRRRKGRGDQPDSERLDQHHQRGARGRPGRAARLLGRLPHHRVERPTARDEHRAVARRRRELGAPAWPGRPRRRPVVCQQHRGDRPPGRLDAAGLRRNARHVGPRGPLAGDPNYDYQAPVGQYGYDPNLATDARAGASWPGIRARVATRRPGTGRGRGRQPRRQRGDDARHERHADRHARPHATRRSHGRRLVRRLSGRLPVAGQDPPVADRRRERAGHRPSDQGEPRRRDRRGRRRAAVGALDEGLRRPGRARQPLEQRRPNSGRW